MDKDTVKVLVFLVIMTVSVAFVLAMFRQVTAATAAQNEDIFNKRAILTAVGDYLGEGVTVDNLKDDEVLEIFEKQVQQEVIDTDGNAIDGVTADEIDMAKEKKKPASERQLPVYTFMNGGEKYVILSVRGNGLWDEIWGNIALKSDLNTIAGASFDHKGETPGLGAEIKDNPSFAEQFKGDKIFEGDQYVSVLVKKGGADASNEHAVDAISGATVTSDGVTQMLYNGIELYLPYLEKLRDGGQVGSLQ